MKKVFKNFIYNLSYQVFSFILPVITVPYITGIISQKTIGVNSVLQANSTYFILLGMLGISTYGSKEIAKIQEDIPCVSSRFFQIFKIQFFSHLFCLFIYFIYLFFIDNRTLGVFYVLNIIASMFDISWFFIGMEDFKSISIRNIFVKLVSFFLLFIFVKGDGDIYAYVCTLYIPQIIINIYMWFKLAKIIHFKLSFLKCKIIKDDLKETISLFIPQVASSVYTILDKTVLGWFETYENIAIYDQGQIILRLVLAIVPSFSKVMMPRISHTINQGNMKKAEKYMIASSNLISFLSFGIFFGILAISDLFVGWYFPSQYENVKYILILCSLIILAVSGSNLISIQFLIPLGKQKIYTFSLIIASITNFVLNMFLIPKMGIIGACLSSSIAEILGFTIQLYFSRNYISLRKLFGNTVCYLLSGTVMWLFLWNLKRYFTSTLISLIILVMIGLSIYAITTFILLKVKTRKSIIELFRVD